jgi:Ca-activated chloride channel family protein
MRRALIALPLVAGLVAAGPSAGVSGQQKPIFRGGTERVRVDVLVTHDGKPVPGLEAADFELKDNGVRQNVEVSTTADSVAVAIVLAVSGATQAQVFPGVGPGSPTGGGPVAEDLQRATQALVDALEPGDRAWLITFAGSFALRIGPTSDRDAVRRAMASVGPSPGASMWDAVFASVGLVTGMAGRSLVIVLTDGMDRTSWLDQARTVDALKHAEVVVDAVRPHEGSIRGLAPLEALTEVTGGAVMYAEKSEKLSQQFVDLLQEFRLGYVLTYAPTSAARANGWHQIDVHLKDKKGDVRARQGYYQAGR